MSLAAARQIAHYAAEWVAQAAWANVPGASDDGHSALESLELFVIQDAKPDRLALQDAELVYVGRYSGRDGRFDSLQNSIAAIANPMAAHLGRAHDAAREPRVPF